MKTIIRWTTAVSFALWFFPPFVGRWGSYFWWLDPSAHPELREVSRIFGA